MSTLVLFFIIGNGSYCKISPSFRKTENIISIESPYHDQFISISFKFIFVFYRFHSLNTRTVNSTDGSRSPNWANTIALFASTKAIDPHTDFPTSLIVMARSRMNRIIHITMALIIYFLMCSIYQRALLVVNNFILWNAKKKRKKSNKSAQSLLNWKDDNFSGPPQHSANVPHKVN